MAGKPVIPTETPKKKLAIDPKAVANNDPNKFSVFSLERKIKERQKINKATADLIDK